MSSESRRSDFMDYSGNVSSFSFSPRIMTRLVIYGLLTSFASGQTGLDWREFDDGTEKTIPGATGARGRSVAQGDRARAGGAELMEAAREIDGAGNPSYAGGEHARLDRSDH